MVDFELVGAVRSLRMVGAPELLTIFGAPLSALRGLQENTGQGLANLVITLSTLD